MTWQAMSPEECRAKILNKAMVGLGTAEDQLIRVICQLNFGERREVKEAYQRMYDRDLPWPVPTTPAFFQSFCYVLPACTFSKGASSSMFSNGTVGILGTTTDPH